MSLTLSEPREVLVDDPIGDDRFDELAWEQRLFEDPSDAVEPGTAGLSMPTLDARELSVPERVDALVRLQRITSRVAALEAELLVSLMGASPVRREVVVLDRVTDSERTLTLTDEMREEVALALRRSPSQVRDQVEQARLLANYLPATCAAMKEGWLSAQHARVIVEQATRLRGAEAATDPSFAQACALLELRIVDRAADLTVSKTRELARRTVEMIDRDAARRRRLAARREIDVRTYAEDDGIAVLFARLTAVDAARVQAAIESHARTLEPAGSGETAGRLDTTGERQTIGERRASALVHLICNPGASVPVGVEIGVVIDLPTLLGLADAPAQMADGTASPIDVSAVREVLDDPRVPVTLRRLVCDPFTGSLVDRGRRSYQVTGRLRDFLIARDATCRFPRCARRADRCQMDHAVPWEDGGRSDTDNLGALCTRHHQLKTHGGWDIVDSRADGSCTWQSPAGGTYQHAPPPVGATVGGEHRERVRA